MAETSGFFRSVSGDRKYTTDWLAKWVSSFISNGVYDGELAVTAGDGMTVTLPAGKAWINGYYYQNDAPITLPISNADGVLHRKDTIALRWDVNERSITAQVIKGAFASSPVAPTIVRTAEQYDLKIAEISIPAGTTAITQALITDTRLDTAVCGIVTGVIDQVDTTTFYNQIAGDLAQFKSTQQADFEAWFDSIKGILGADEAGNLLNMINAVSADLTQHKSDTTAHITAAERTTWNAGITSVYTHSKSGTVHTLTGSGNNISFKATAAISAGDTWKVNSTTVTATLQNGDALPADLFKSGYWVTGVRMDGTKLNFRAGASTVLSIFGNGSDGDAVISGTVTLPVPVPHQSIVEKQYKSLTINAGAILKAAAHNAGLIIRVQGDCTIHGTIDQSGLAPKTNVGNNYAYPSQLVCGNGGNGGRGGSYASGGTYGAGGVAMLKRSYGGGYGAGGGGGNGYGFTGGAGGSSTGITVDVSNIFLGGAGSAGYAADGTPPAAGTYGGGGGSGGTTAGLAGASGAGSDGVSSTDNSKQIGGSGGAGNYGGGVILLYVGGNLLIDGSIKCNGGAGGAGGRAVSSSGTYVGCAGGGAGGGGGGAIYIMYKGSYTNTGILQVNGGAAGAKGLGQGADYNTAGTAGGVGSITAIQYTS